MALNAHLRLKARSGPIQGSVTEVQSFTVRLTNALIASITMQLPNTTHPDQVKLDTFEEIAFRYEKIEWTWTDGDVSATDDWLSGIA